jgi:universal stress protein A
MHLELKRICVPTDFSEAAERALLYGVTLAETLSAQLHVLHVLQDVGDIVAHPDFTRHGDSARKYFNELALEAGGPEGEDEQTIHFLRTLQQGAEKQFEEAPLGDRMNALGAIRAIRYGNPVEEIIKYAERHEIDLLVLGTHGRTGWKRMLMGSVAERVVRGAPCPVLTVRDREPRDLLRYD